MIANRFSSRTLLLVVAALATACSVGNGTGDVKATNLFAANCWKGGFDLKPDFFAAVPFRNTLYIREQRGSDFQGVSDGVTILVDDLADTRTNHLNQALPVSLPRGVAPPGVAPGVLCGANCGNGVHLTFFLLHSCFNENTALYAVSGTITFKHLFSGDPNESDAAQKLSEGSFDVMVANPQDVVASGPNAGTIPNQSELTGTFRFFFERGQPAQPFP